jgi:NADH/NAD ratio-sensing transcriptional regulator Rex
MSRSRIQVTPHLSHAEITQRYKTCSNDRIKTYWQAILLLSQDDPYLSVEEVANTVHLSTDWVRKLVHRYNHFGAAGLTGEYAKNATSRSQFQTLN